MPKRARQSTSSNAPLILAVVIALGFALWQTREKVRLEATAEAAELNAQALQERHSSTMQEQEEQILELTELLQRSTDKLQQATAALTNRASALATPAGLVPPPLTTEDVRELQSEIKAPSVEVVVGQDGEETAIYTFPELVSPEGELLGADMKFSRRYGSKFAFRDNEGQPVSFDAAALHPGILTHLGIDPYEAQREQDALEEKQARRKEMARLRQIARLQAEAERAELAKELRKEAFERQARLAELENERTKAEAAMKQADAAMVEANKPPPTLINNPAISGGFGLQTIVVPATSTANGPLAQNSVGQRAASGIQNTTAQPAQSPPVFTQPSRQPRLPGQLRTGQ